MRKGKDPEPGPYLWLIDSEDWEAQKHADPDPGPKHDWGDEAKSYEN